MSERITRELFHRVFFGRGISNPKMKEMAAKVHFIVERGTCTLKDKKEGK